MTAETRGGPRRYSRRSRKTAWRPELQSGEPSDRTVADDPLEAGREAAARGAYADAYALLRGVGQLTGEDLEHLAEAAYWTGRLDEAIETRERAYTAHLDAGAKARRRGSRPYCSRLLRQGISEHLVRLELEGRATPEGQPESVANGYLAFKEGRDRDAGRPGRRRNRGRSAAHWSWPAHTMTGTWRPWPSW